MELLIMENYKLNKEEYEKLFYEDITLKDYNETIAKIENRFDYIIRKIAKNLVWYDYENGRENYNGYFEPNDYDLHDDSYIQFQGEYSLDDPYKVSGIPIRWLWEDFENEFVEEVKTHKSQLEKKKIESKIKRAEAKAKKLLIKEAILNKLTKEELKYIKFK